MGGGPAGARAVLSGCSSLSGGVVFINSSANHAVRRSLRKAAANDHPHLGVDFVKRTQTWNAPYRFLDSRGMQHLRLGATRTLSRSRRPPGSHDGAARWPAEYSSPEGDLVGRALR